MKNPIIKIDTRKIRDWASFHDLFAEVMGFPKFYGRNMDAWIDCMTSVDAPADGMSSIHAPLGGVIVLQFDHVADFAARCPEIYAAVIECSAFVNWRRTEVREEPVLAISFSKSA